MHKRSPLPLLLLVDAVGIVCAFLWAFVLYLGTNFEATRANWEIFTDLRFAVLLVAVRLLIYEMCGLYDLHRDPTILRHVLYGLLAAVLAGLFDLFSLLMLQTFYLHDIQPSRGLIATNVLTSWLLLVVWRVLYTLRRGPRGEATPVLIVGAGPLGNQVWREIDRYSRSGHRVVGFLDDEHHPGRNEEGHPVLGRIQDLPAVVRNMNVREVIVTSSQATRSEMLDLIEACRRTGVRAYLLPELYEIMIGKVAIHPVAGMPLIELPSPAPGFRPPGWKRLFDLAGSAVGLALTALLHPFIALAIKLDSRGPVFYTQQRVGLGERPYTLYKYRTMCVGAEDMSGPTLSSEGDPRVTRVGCWLRRFYLDELPQLYNVLRGEMSLVGPRPERPAFVREFADRVPAYRYRFLVRPGMTGLAQVHSYYASDVAHKIRYDVSYINTLSFLLDVKVLFLTLKVLVTGRRIA